MSFKEPLELWVNFGIHPRMEGHFCNLRIRAVVRKRIPAHHIFCTFRYAGCWFPEECLEEFVEDCASNFEPVSSLDYEFTRKQSALISAFEGADGSLRRSFSAVDGQHATCLYVGTFVFEQGLIVLGRALKTGVDPAAAKSPAAGFNRQEIETNDLHVFLGGTASKYYVGLFYGGESVEVYPTEIARRGMPVRGTFVLSPDTMTVVRAVQKMVTPELKKRIQEQLTKAAAQPASAHGAAGSVARQLVRRRRSAATPDAEGSSSASSVPTNSSSASAAAAADGSSSPAASPPSNSVHRRPSKAARR